MLLGVVKQASLWAACVELSRDVTLETAAGFGFGFAFDGASAWVTNQWPKPSDYPGTPYATVTEFTMKG
jgi:hypothetical protein